MTRSQGSLSIFVFFNSVFFSIVPKDDDEPLLRCRFICLIDVEDNKAPICRCLLVFLLISYKRL